VVAVVAVAAVDIAVAAEGAATVTSAGRTPARSIQRLFFCQRCIAGVSGTNVDGVCRIR
jgi:hypothetical protein